MTKKLKVSKEIAEALEIAKKVDLTISEILKFKNKNYPFKEEFKVLTNLSKEDLINGLFYEYEVEKEKLKELPLEFKFKYKANQDYTFHAYTVENSIVVSYLNHKKEIEATHHSIENCIFYFNTNQWIMLDS